MSYLVVSWYWYCFHLCHKYHKPQKMMAIQSQNCTSFLSYSGNQIFLLINNRDVTKRSVFNKNIGFFPHPCLVILLIVFGIVEVFSLASNCWKLFTKGNSPSARNRRFCLTFSISLIVWHFIELEKRFFQQLSTLFSWITPAKLQFKAWANTSQPQRRVYKKKRNMENEYGRWLGWPTGPGSHLMMALACSQPSKWFGKSNNLAQTISHPVTNPHSAKIYFSQEIIAAIRNSTTDCQLVGASC